MRMHETNKTTVLSQQSTRREELAKKLDEFFKNATPADIQRAENIMNNATKKQAPDFYQMSKSDQIDFLSRC